MLDDTNEARVFGSDAVDFEPAAPLASKPSTMRITLIVSVVVLVVALMRMAMLLLSRLINRLRRACGWGGNPRSRRAGRRLNERPRAVKGRRKGKGGAAAAHDAETLNQTRGLLESVPEETAEDNDADDTDDDEVSIVY